MEREPDDKNDKNQRHIIASLALRQRFNSLCDPTSNKAEKGKSAGYSYKPACMMHQYQAWVTNPTASTNAQAMSGFVSLCSSSSNTPSASPLRSMLSKHSDTKFDIGSAFMPSFKSTSDVGLPVSSYTAVSSSQKTMEQQAQYPVLASLTTSSSPVINVPDSVSVNPFPLHSARTSQPIAGGSLLQESFSTMTPPALPKSSLNMSSSNFSYKSVNISNVPTIASPIKTLPVLTPMRTKTNTSSFHSSPTKCHDPYPSLQERIESPTISATTSVNDAFDEVVSTLNFEKLKTVPISTPSSYQPIQSSGSVYDFRRSSLSFTTSVTYSTVAMPVYSVINVSPEQQFKKMLPDISKTTAACLSSKKSVVSEENVQVPSTFARVLSPDKSLAFRPTGPSSSTLSNSQEILKDVHEMKKNIIGKSAVLQTDTCSVSKGFQSDSHKEHKIEGKEQYKIMEKVKRDLIKVSEILNNNIMKEGKKCKKDSKAEDLEDDAHKNQQNRWWCPPRYETVAPQVKTRVMTHRDFNLAKVVDYLTNDIGTNSLSKSVTAAQTNEETRKQREEKPNHVSKPAMAVQKCKFKTAPFTIHPSPSEKELSKLTDTLFGTETILDSDDIFHDQDKSPLSDSGFDTRSERTPSVPQSTDSMGSRGPSQKISPAINETWTETVQVIRSYKSSGDTSEPIVDEVKIANSPAQCTDIEFRLHSGSNKDRVKMNQARSSPEKDITYKGMRLKEETHITTTTRMLYYKPARNETTSEIFKKTTMKSLQPGQDSSREFTGLFQHEGGNKGWQEPHDTMPKVEHIIEVHIEKENKTEPTEIIIMETKNHPEKEIYIYQCSSSKNGLQNREEVEKVISTFLQDDDERITTVKLKIEDLHKTLKLQRPHSVESHENDSSIIRREPNEITDKKLFTEKFDSSCSGSDQALTESSHYFERRTNGGSMRRVILKPDKSGGVIDDNETHDNLSLLQYASDPVSPKKSFWTRIPDDRQRESTGKNRFEVRVDKTVKEAEEKLSETSLFFRNKTEKMKDELQSSEEKNHRPNIRETQSVPSSTCSSPGKNVLKNGGGREEWSKERFRDRYSPYERKCASLPSSPKGCLLLQYCDNRKQGGYSSKSSKSFQPSTSKFSLVSMKFEDKAIMKDQRSQYSQTAGALVKKLQENKLPIYQVFAGGGLPNLSDSGEHCPKEVLDSEVRQGYNVTKAQLFNVCDTTLKYNKTLYSNDKFDTTWGSCVSGYHKSQTPQIFPNYEKDTLVYSDGNDKPIKKEKNKKIISVQTDVAGSHIPSLTRSKHCSCDVNNKFGDVCSLGSINVVCNNENVTADIKPLPIYVKSPVDKKYKKETDTSRPRTCKKAVSHVNQAMHEAREEVYTNQMIKKKSSSQGNPNDKQAHINFMEISRGSSNTETSNSVEVNYDLNSERSDFSVGTPSSIVEQAEEEHLPKTIIFRELPAEKSKAVTPTELYKGTHRSPGKQDTAKQVPYSLNTRQSDQLELKKGSSTSEANTKMIEMNLQEEHDRHLFAEPVIQIHLPSPLQSGADDIDSSDDESVIQLIPLKKYNFKMSQNGEKCIKPRNPDRNDSHHNESQSINGVIQGDDEDEQNDNDQSVTDCSIATTAEFSHDTDATEIDSLDGYDLQDEDDGLSDTKILSLSNEGKTGNPYFSQTQLEFKKELTPNEHSEEKAKSKSNLYKKTESGKDQSKVYSLEGRHPDRQEFSDKYFSYKHEAELPSTYKAIVTKDSDLDPWSNKRREEEGVETKSKDEDPKPFGLLIEDKSQATTPDSTLARTPTDDSTPTSEPNPFPFHEGKMFEMTRSGAIDMSKQDFVEERLQFFQIGPQSPCERTDLRIAIVADHLGLSWTELAREMNFSVDEINHIRTENPNSLTAQSFMLLKKWVSRDGKDATTDALTAGLTKVNRMDIVTLLEGPIFDYGIISGTRSFADDSVVKKENGKV